MVWTVAGGLISIIGIFQYLSPDIEFLLQSAPPSSTFGNKNIAAHPLVLIFTVVLFIIFYNKINTMQSFLTGFLMAVIVIYIFYTATKSAWLAIFIELLFVTLFLRLKRKKINNCICWNRTKTLALSLSVLLIFIIINLSADGFTPVWQTATNEISSMIQSISNKNGICYEISINMIKDAPLFGTGFGSWSHNEVQAEYKNELFYLLLLVALGGSFIKMPFSLPYQMSMPSLLFGLYLGLIAKQSERFLEPRTILCIKSIKNINESWCYVVFDSL